MPTALGTVASHRSVISTVPIPTTGLQLWLDADDASTFTISTAGGVAQWRDKSGSSHHAAHLVPSTCTQPTRNVTINGHTAIKFDAGAYTPGQEWTYPHLRIPEFAAAYTSGELFMVLRVDNQNNGSYHYRFGDTSSFSHYPIGTTAYETWGTTSRQSITIGGTNVTAPHIYNVRTAPSLYEAAFNGTKTFTTTANIVKLGTAGVAHEIAQYDNLPIGVICEYVMYNRVLSTVERQQVEAYLTAKWIAPAAPIPTTGLVGWYDADDATTFTYSSGALVSQWRDKSGSNHHGNATGGAYPTRTAAAVNEHAAVSFTTSAVIDVLGTTLPANSGAPFTLFGVLKPTAVTGNSILGTTGYGLGWDLNNGQRRLMVQASSVIGASTTPIGANQLVLVGADMGAGTWRHFLNGAADGTGSGSGYGEPSAVTAIGGFRANDANFKYQGLICELIKYDRVLSTVERQQVEAYLKDKWIPFHPLTSIPWHSAFWASDPAWTPPADGAPVTSWRNAGTSGANATPDTGQQPTYRAAFTALNGKPAVDFGTTARPLVTGSPTITQPLHVVLIGWQDPAGNGQENQITDGTLSRTIIENFGAGANFKLYAGDFIDYVGAGRTGPFVFITLHATSSAHRSNGTAYTGGNAGSNGIGGLKLGAGNGGPFMKGALSFVGVKASPLTAQEIADLETWAKTYYGVPMP